MGKGIRNYFVVFINCLIFLLSGNFAYSQSIISGTVKDTLQNPIPHINVILKIQNQDGIIAFATTQENGYYELTTDRIGDMELTFSSLSFKETTIPFSLEKNTNKIFDMVLKEETFALDEVIINTDKAITIKKDTIIFKADAFKKGNEETVEDLLRNIPGISVERDGKIKVGNREIEKIMVEGDDLFEKGYALLTKNLDASTINTVEVYENYSQNRLLKGIEDSEKIALNLTLKDNVKNKIFGTLKPGYGLISENRYDVSANIVSFRQSNRIYGFANLNNIGIESTAALSDMMDSGRGNNIGEFGNDEHTAPLIKLINYKPNVGNERINFNNAEMGSLNNIYSITSKVKLKTISFLNWDENDYFRKSEHTYFLPLENFTTTEDYRLYAKTISGFANTELTYDVSENEIFEYSGKYSGNRSKTNSFLFFNNDSSMEYLEEHPFETQQRFKYTNKLKANQVLLINGYFHHASNPQKYNNSRFLFEELFPIENHSGVSQRSANTLNILGFDTGLLTKRANNHLWETKIGLDYTTNHHISNFRIMGIDEKPQGFQNHSKYRQMNGFLESSYGLKINSFSLTGNIRFVQNFINLKNEDSKQETSPFFINPKISLDWQINKHNRIFSFVRYGKHNLNYKNVQNGYVLTQYNQFLKGIENMGQLSSSTFFFNHTLGTILSTFYANTSFIYIKNHDYLGSKSVIAQNYTLNELIWLKDKEFYNFQTDSNIYFQSIASNLKIKLGYNLQNFENIVNGNLRDVTVSTFRYGGEIRTAFSGAFNFHIGTEWSKNTYKSMINQDNTTNYSFVDIVYEPFENVLFSLNSSRYYFKDLDTENNTYCFMDFEGKYQIIKNKLSIALVGKNLLNTRTFWDVNVSDIGVFKSEYQLLPRFFLLKANIRL